MFFLAHGFVVSLFRAKSVHGLNPWAMGDSLYSYSLTYFVISKAEATPCPSPCSRSTLPVSLARYGCFTQNPSPGATVVSKP